MGVMAGHVRGAAAGRFLILAAAIVAALFFASTASAATPAPAPVTKGTQANSDKITLNFQNVDINALINTVSQITGKNFIVDPRVKGKVTIVSGTKLSVAEVYQVFLSVLEVHNFAAVEGADGVTKIVPLSVAKQSATPTSFSTPRTSDDAQITQIYHLQHGSVKDMVPVLRPLLPPTSHFAAYEPSNSLIFTDSAANIKRILKIIHRIDRPQPEGNVHVVYLHYASADDLVKILNNILLAKQKAGDAREKNEAVGVQAEKSTNSLIIQANNDDFAFIRNVIDRLDIRRAQVFIEVLIAEVSTNKAHELGIQWQFGDNNLANGQTSGSTTFPSASSGLTLGYLKSLVTDLAGNQVPSLQVVLNALETDANTNILSTPNLLTLDNESAEITVGQEVPFITGEYTTTGTTTTTSTTTGTTITNPFQTIERKDVGLTLKIKPQINAGNSIRLQIQQEVSSISPTTVQGAADIITNKRSIKATVMADDGQIIVLGGLMKDDVEDNISSVPVLGKIPVVGSLFRYKKKTAVKTNLMVFLRPKIIRTNADLAEYTESRYKSTRKLQQHSNPDSKYLLYGSKPPVMPAFPKNSTDKLGPPGAAGK